jgi:hypothetical protein
MSTQCEVIGVVSIRFVTVEIEETREDEGSLVVQRLSFTCSFEDREGPRDREFLQAFADGHYRRTGKDAIVEINARQYFFRGTVTATQERKVFFTDREMAAINARDAYFRRLAHYKREMGDAPILAEYVNLGLPVPQRELRTNVHPSSRREREFIANRNLRVAGMLHAKPPRAKDVNFAEVDAIVSGNDPDAPKKPRMSQAQRERERKMRLAMIDAAAKKAREDHAAKVRTERREVREELERELERSAVPASAVRRSRIEIVD